MFRYFLEFAYKGTKFNGLQTQLKGITVQDEINSTLQIFLKTKIETTTSSRTDAGVHALQNFLHFDTDLKISDAVLYNLNAIVHQDIVFKKITLVSSRAHSRFDATQRKYAYHIIQKKNPFFKEIAFFYPFHLDIDLMNQAAEFLLKYNQYKAFSKKHTDVKTFECNITTAYFEVKEEEIIFHIVSNRFLRGMVRGIVGTLLQVGRKKITPLEFEEIIIREDSSRVDFSTPALGLFLEKVSYPESIFQTT